MERIPRIKMVDRVMNTEFRKTTVIEDVLENKKLKWRFADHVRWLNYKRFLGQIYKLEVRFSVGNYFCWRS